MEINVDRNIDLDLKFVFHAERQPEETRRRLAGANTVPGFFCRFAASLVMRGPRAHALYL